MLVHITELLWCTGNSGTFTLNLPRSSVQDSIWCISNTTNPAPSRAWWELMCDKSSVKCTVWKDVSSAALLVSPGPLPLVQIAPYRRHNLNAGPGQRPTALSIAQQTAQLETTNSLCSLLNNTPGLCWSKDKASEWGVPNQESWSPYVTPALSLAAVPKKVTYSNTFQSSLTLVRDRKVDCPLLERNDEFLGASI